MNLSAHIQYFEAMSVDQALELLQKHDKSFPDDPNEEALNKFRRKFAKKFHPDVSDDDGDTLKAINNAIDTLKKSGGKRKSGGESYSRERGVPVWQTDKRASFNNIHEENYSDLNYIKKHAWELAGKKPNPTPLDVATYWNFDGSYSRGVFSVYSNERTPVYKEIAKAMIQWDHYNRSKAVLIVHASSMYITVFPVYDKEVSDDYFSIPFGDSFNKNPFNDQQFVKRLKERLDEKAKERDKED